MLTGLNKTDKKYANIKVYHPDGTLMFRCSQRRLDFYLGKNLVDKIEDNSYKLNFIPKGYGKHDVPYEISEKTTHCVVCGTKENLSQHHVIPSCFKKFFPDEFKKHNSYDVLFTCVDCHHKYEFAANEFKAQLFDRADLSKYNDCQKSNLGMNFFAKSLLKHKDKMPAEKVRLFEQKLSSFYNMEVSSLTNEFLANLIEENFKKYRKANKKITENRNILAVKKFFNKEDLTREDYIDFIIAWRRHFVEHAKPKHLSPYWEVENREIFKDAK